MKNTALRAFIADDEPAACSNLERALCSIEGASVVIIGTAHNTREVEILTDRKQTAKR